MELQIIKITNKQFVSTISPKKLISSVSDVYKKDIETINQEYLFENISEEYSEYVISSMINNNIYIDNIVLFTKEKFNNNNLSININKFVVGDGISKLSIMNNLLKTKKFILKRIYPDNIDVFKDLYKSLFVAETKLPGYYLNAVMTCIGSRFDNDIRKFDVEFLTNSIPITIITDSNTDFMKEYIYHKNATNKLITLNDLEKKASFKMIPYMNEK